MKQNFRGFTFKYETLRNMIEIILSYKGRVSYDKYVINSCNINFYCNLMTSADKQFLSQYFLRPLHQVLRYNQNNCHITFKTIDVVLQIVKSLCGKTVQTLQDNNN